MTQKSITRLLAERKALVDRIRTASTVLFIGMKKGEVVPVPVGYVGKTIDQVSTLLKANLDKARGLINYHTRITAAIIASNAAVKVTIGGEEMTVAEAIERKSSIVFEKTLLATALQQAGVNQVRIDNENQKVDETVERQLIALYGGDKSKMTAEARKEVSDGVNKHQRHGSIDPNNLSEFIKIQMEKLHLFEVEVDFILSESNARTVIVIADENGTVVVPSAPNQEHGTFVVELG